MKYFDIVTTVILKKDIPYTQSFEIISKTLNFLIAKDEFLKRFHFENFKVLF